jgi:hypothetical protein
VKGPGRLNHLLHNQRAKQVAGQIFTSFPFLWFTAIMGVSSPRTVVPGERCPPDRDNRSKPKQARAGKGFRLCADQNRSRTIA